MNIDWAIPCRFLEVHDNLATIVGAGIDTFWIQEDLPTAIGLMLAVRLTGLPEEFTPDQKHRAVSRIKDPSGNTLSEMIGEISIDAESARPDYLTATMIPLVIQLEVAEEGTYAIECEFGDAWKSLPIHVVLGAPPG